MKKILLVGVCILVLSGLYFFYGKKEVSLSVTDFEIMRVEKGRIVEEVTASGKIQPINTVSVGTQVSGIVEKVLADYNDEVKEGELLAQLDTAVLIENKNDDKRAVFLSRYFLQNSKITKIDKVEKIIGKSLK